jgi:TatD DNase family protein
MMALPAAEDYIDIHTHGACQVAGIFSVEVLMAHEGKEPEDLPGLAYTYGIHPWYLDESGHDTLISSVKKITANPLVIAVGEAGFDKIKGPSMELQRKTFEEQVLIAEEYKKPVVVHCVRAWDELLAVNKKMRPRMPWLVHGFRGKRDLAFQLIEKGMYLSFWFDFILKPESSQLVRSLPADRIFLETDGSGVDIKDIYNKVSSDLGLTVNKLKSQILLNFIEFLKKKEFNHGVTRSHTEKNTE